MRPELCGQVVQGERVPVAAPKRLAILRLLDGQMTARDIAQSLGTTDACVRAVAHKMGMAHRLRRAYRAPIAAPLPVDLLVRDLQLAPSVAAWLQAQAVDGVTVQDVIRAALVDAYLDEVAT